MIGDDDMVITRGVEVPKEMSELSCGALVAGIVEAVMDGAGFVSVCPRSATLLCPLTFAFAHAARSRDGTLGPQRTAPSAHRHPHQARPRGASKGGGARWQVMKCNDRL